MTDGSNCKDSDVKYPETASPEVEPLPEHIAEGSPGELSALRKTNIMLESRNYELRESVRQARLMLAAAESERDQYRREARKYKTETSLMIFQRNLEYSMLLSQEHKTNSS